MTDLSNKLAEYLWNETTLTPDQIKKLSDGVMDVFMKHLDGIQLNLLDPPVES